VEAEDALKEWMEQVPFTRKEVTAFRNIARDFSDGLCVAEVVKYYCPKLVDMHNYHKASSTQQKIDNWRTLNTKVLSKLDVKVPKAVVQKIVDYQPGVMQMVLTNIKIKIEQYMKPRDRSDEPPPKKKGAARKKGAVGARKKPPPAAAPAAAGGGDEDESSAAAAAAAPADNKSGTAVGGAKKGGRSKRVPTATTHELIESEATPIGGGAIDDVDADLLRQCMADYAEVNAMLLSKVKKLEVLVKMKDKRILALERKCTENGIKA